MKSFTLIATAHSGMHYADAPGSLCVVLTPGVRAKLDTARMGLGRGQQATFPCELIASSLICEDGALELDTDEGRALPEVQLVNGQAVMIESDVDTAVPAHRYDEGIVDGYITVTETGFSLSGRGSTSGTPFSTNEIEGLIEERADNVLEKGEDARMTLTYRMRLSELIDLQGIDAMNDDLDERLSGMNGVASDIGYELLGVTQDGDMIIRADFEFDADEEEEDEA